VSSPAGVRIDPGAVRRTLRAAGLRAQRRFSQNFLVDVDVLEAILVAAAPAPGRRILEIGPGLGILTGGLLGAGALVTAVEIDRGMVAHLEETFAAEIAAGTLTLVEGDVLDEDLAALVTAPYDVVANLPYHVTSPVLHLLLGGEAGPRPERCVLMVQREVAERIAAPPGSMSYLSVFVQYHAVPVIVRRVPRAAFEPAPEVESAVLALDVRDADAAGRLPPAMEDSLWRLVQAGFRERRKMLHNVLPRQLPIEPATITAALEEAGIAGDRRPQTLGVGEWIALLGALGPLPEDRRGRRATREPDVTRGGEPGPGAARDPESDPPAPAGDPPAASPPLAAPAGDPPAPAGDPA
jgi:16S rRNA (adenine1518-N6/adenine1519-N6)-dimethyltransferase